MVGGVDPDPCGDGTTRVQLREQASYLLRRIRGRNLIGARAGHLVGGDVLRARARGYYGGQAGGRVEKFRHVRESRGFRTRDFLQGRKRHVEVDMTARDHDLEPDRDALLLDGVDRVAVRWQPDGGLRADQRESLEADAAFGQLEGRADRFQLAHRCRAVAQDFRRVDLLTAYACAEQQRDNCRADDSSHVRARTISRTGRS